MYKEFVSAQIYETQERIKRMQEGLFTAVETLNSAQSTLEPLVDLQTAMQFFHNAWDVPLQVYIDSTQDIQVSFTGPREGLLFLLRHLYRHGWRPSSKPEKGTSYCAFFENAELETRIWFNFTSTSCRRVQVRTERQDVPIYETICDGGDLSTLSPSEYENG